MKKYYGKVTHIEFRRCDPNNPSEQEYGMHYNNNFLGYIEYHLSWNKFIFEPTHWAHITTENLEQILVFIKELEKNKRRKNEQQNIQI